MPCSPERLAANRANSQLSSGPKTEAGKLASRRNAIKHGLTGEGLAMPDEDAAEVEAAFDRHALQMKPKTEVGIALVFKVALAGLRLKRFAQVEAATLAERVATAGERFDADRIAERDDARSKLIQDPKGQLPRLAQLKVGAEWMIQTCEMLRHALTVGTQPAWSQHEFSLFEALMGRPSAYRSRDESATWNLAAWGDARALASHDLPGDTPAAKAQFARARMIEVVDAEHDRWRLHLDATLAPTERARANAIKMARYDGSREGLLAKKYEAATSRELYKALKEFRLVEAEFAEAEPVAETSESQEVCAELGSFLPEADRGDSPAPDHSGETSRLPAAHLRAFEVPESERFDAISTPIPVDRSGESRRS